MRRTHFCVLAVFAAVATATAPALAAPKCNDRGPGLHVEFGFHVGSPYTRQEQEIFDKMALRKEGVNARTVARTDDGCLAAWVPNGRGGFTTEYYDPRTLELKLD